MNTIQVGESLVTTPIRARRRWNRTGVVLEPNAVYRLIVDGDQHWSRWRRSYDADGKRVPLPHWYRRFLRVPRANPLALAGSIGRGKPFLIGRQRPYFKPSEAGELLCFANDSFVHSWRNRGQVRLTIVRIK